MNQNPDDKYIYQMTYWNHIFKYIYQFKGISNATR